MIERYPVIITASDPQWTNGLGMLYEPFSDDQTNSVYSVLHIAASDNIPHGKAGYYPLTSTQVPQARRHGLLLTNADGDLSGYQLPQAGPCHSLGAALNTVELTLPPVEGITYPRPPELEPLPLTLDQLLELKTRTPRPLMYCLCGSTSKAQDAFESERLRLTLAYQKVLTIGANAKDSDLGITAEQKDLLDVLHLYKIDDADIVRIVNPGGYIGTSTRRELEYARRLGKKIEFLEEPDLTQTAQKQACIATT